MRHGAVPTGADFNSESGQTERFRQFPRLLDLSQPFSIIDYGCGYGALATHLLDRGFPLKRYVGFDISKPMVEAARERLPNSVDWRLTMDVEDIGTADFCIASGIFNVKLSADTATWHAMILQTLDIFARVSRRGFAFNMLTSYSEPEKMRSDLYYGDPHLFFDHCVLPFFA